MEKPIRIIIVDNHEVVIDGLEAMFINEPSIQVVGKASGAAKLLDMIRARKPVDVILMDVDMPEMNGIEATVELKKINADLKVLLLTMHNDRGLISEAISNGANGYLLKDHGKKDLIEAIQKVNEGQLVVQTPKQPGTRPTNYKFNSVELTKREKEIVCLIVKERITREIAEELKIAPTTVERHRQNIMIKLGVRNVVGIVRYALENGICD